MMPRSFVHCIPQIPRLVCSAYLVATQAGFHAFRSRVCAAKYFQQRCLASLPRELKNKNYNEVSNQLKEVTLDGDLTVKKLAKKLGTSAGSVIKVLKDVGEDVKEGVHTTLDLDIAEFVTLEFGMTPVLPDLSVLEQYTKRPISTDSALLVPRPPVVTIMGHVDHGKTTLLDKLRQTKVAEGEAGGITQHIGAFSVTLESGKKITFIDTPGHAAFNAMRGRGAKVTDFIVLVVSAEDGVKEQTLECIKHAESTKVPIIVAINKIDKHRANPLKVKQELLQHGIQLEEYGGEVPSVEISALKGLNLNKLEETIILQAEMAELKAEDTGFAEGVILEAETHKQKGLMATILVQRGKLLRGDNIIAGNAFAKIRQLYNDAGHTVTEALPSMPVQVLGWRSLPQLGDHVLAIESQETAKKIIRMRELKERRDSQDEIEVEKLTDRFPHERDANAANSSRRRKLPLRVALRQKAAKRQVKETEEKDDKLSLIIKADYSGSLEAFVDILNSFKSDRIHLEIASSGVGQINENDIRMAEVTNGIVYGFNVQASKDIEKLSKQVGVPIKSSAVIYKLMDDVQEELCSRLPKIPIETVVGEANVLQIFQLTGQKKAIVAGCRVKKGTLNVDENVVWRVCRDEEVIHQGPLKSLKHGKQDIQVAKKETECGIAFEQFVDVQEDDKIQCVRITYEKQTLNWSN